MMSYMFIRKTRGGGTVRRRMEGVVDIASGVEITNQRFRTP